MLDLLSPVHIYKDRSLDMRLENVLRYGSALAVCLFALSCLASRMCCRGWNAEITSSNIIWWGDVQACGSVLAVALRGFLLQYLVPQDFEILTPVLVPPLLPLGWWR